MIKGYFQQLKQQKKGCNEDSFVAYWLMVENCGV